MHIGIALETTSASGHVADLARYIEGAGFDALFFPEHVAVPVDYDTYYRWGNDGKLPEHYNGWPDPYIALAIASAVTNRIQLGTGISILPEHEPIALAKTIATLDFYANGRTIFAFGAGWLNEEMALFGIDFDTRWLRLRESIGAMKAMWSEREATYRGKLISFPPVRCEPKPRQPGGPKVLLGVHGAKRAIPIIAEHCDGWFPLVHDADQFARDVRALRQATEDAGRDPESILLYPLLVPTGMDVPPEKLDKLRSVGVHHVMLTSDDHGERNTTGRAREFVDLLQHLVERAHRLC
jgi:probable F420-dependent oxidoreductase